MRESMYYELASYFHTYTQPDPTPPAAKTSTGNCGKPMSTVLACVMTTETAPTTSQRNNNYQQQNAGNRQQYAPRPSTYPCQVCGSSEHRIMKCPTYLALDRKGRINWLNNSKRCQQCLSPRHTIDQCPPANTCYICGAGNHHTSICEQRWEWNKVLQLFFLEIKQHRKHTLRSL